jgi:hypothetical protein
VNGQGRTEWLEERPRVAEPVADGSLACPSCDAPAPLAGPAGPADALACGYCGRAGAVRDFLTLGRPTRPARVVVRARIPR